MGLDLSTKAAAAFIAPLGWNGDWLLTRQLVVGEPLTKQADDVDLARRLGVIAEQICRFAHDYRVGVAWFESYAFGIRFGAHTAGELKGVVRHELVRQGVIVHTANMGTARKLILGHVPRGKGASKTAVFKALRAAGMPFPTGQKDNWLDRADAFVAGNFGLSEAGAFCFVQGALLSRR